MAENARNGVSEKHSSHCCPKEDRLSEMPDSILLHILSFLPAKDVVKTGVVSHRWEYLWTSARILDFISPFWPVDDWTSEKHENFINFVKKTLISHQCTHLKRFLIECLYKESDNDFVDTCVCFAIRANVEELCLDLTAEETDDGGHEPYKLPQYLFKNTTIMKLLLSGCELEPTGLINWKMLKSLTIGYIELNENLIQNILAGSPALEYLELLDFYELDCLDIRKSNLKKLVLNSPNGSLSHEYQTIDLEIIAPKLLSLNVVGIFQRRTFSLTSVDMVDDCTMTFGLAESGNAMEKYVEHAIWTRELLKSLGHVNKLSLGNWCIENLSIMVKEDLPFPQFHGKYLRLDTSLEECDLPGIESLLRRSPNLETLVINMNVGLWRLHSYDYDFDVENYWTSDEGSSECSLLHLKTVEIFGCKPGSSTCEFVIPFAQFLLKSARVLEKMIINAKDLHIDDPSPLAPQPNEDPQPCDAAQAWNLNQVTQTLLRFPRSSPQAIPDEVHIFGYARTNIPDEEFRIGLVDEFLLKSARVLEKMVINAQKHPLVQSQKAHQPCDAAHQMTQKLLRFPTSSPRAEVIFSE